MTIQAILIVAWDVGAVGNQQAISAAMVLKLVAYLSWLFAAYRPAAVLALPGPSGAVQYAVGIVPHIRQLQAKDRGFHLETSVSTPQVSTWATAFHNVAERKPRSVHHRSIRQWRQKVCTNLKRAA